MVGQRELFKALFVAECVESVDANYVFSILMPTFSVDGSSRRSVENILMDNFQDYLIMLEDETVTGVQEVFSNGEYEEDAQKMLQLTPAGVLKWITGSDHKPLDHADSEIIVEFNHDCFVSNPHHTICFPTVHACSRNITLPVAHMKTFDGFKEIFTLAYCNAQAFGVP